MILQTARMIVSEFMHVVNPWRHAAVGSQVLVNPGAFGLGLSGSDDHEREELFGPLWFAVPKKRVSVWHIDHARLHVYMHALICFSRLCADHLVELRSPMYLPVSAFWTAIRVP